MKATQHFTAFDGFREFANGSIDEIRAAAAGQAVLVFDDETGEQVEIDFRDRATPPPEAEIPRGRGRPRLGVVAREVTLLPRHWEWLAEQPGGASVALRKLVEAARRDNPGRDRARRAREATYRVMSALAGNLPNFEEANRALFAANRSRFEEMIAAWPADVRTHLMKMATPSFSSVSEEAADVS